MSARHLAAFGILAFFFLYFFSSGFSFQLWLPSLLVNTARTPDFGRYTPPRVLSENQFPLNDQHRRVIILGDVHGMEKPFQALLGKLSYDPSSDVLVHAGDIIAKGPHEGSMAVLSYMTTHNITGVRGNHDQKVIEWRSWLEWMRALDGGKSWLREFHAKWEEAEAAGVDDPEKWAEKHMKKSKSKWWKKIPDGWKILSDHYRIAHAMSDTEYKYLLSLPLVLHVPSAHAFIAHAGVLPSDPRYKPYHPRQPLARVPTLPKGISHDKTHPEKTIPLLRRLQETAVLTDVPQNNDPWVTLNMRGVMGDNSVTRGKGGEPWSDIWNRDVSNCAGFDQQRHLTKHSKNSLPCYPATVVYGHAASRGLDVKRWSIGLDSGCVTEKRLSALVLDSESQKSPFGDEEIEIEARKKISVPFGEGTGRIISVSCSS
ncbi:calcineurin-like phosphoesterase [Mycena maculata]|uniref:Calcineurin-like phosphoesterase n=1 Tax=Mycena maculata TaxID=230809 RepID=A0AAD7NCT8_9AGAR|nr:calcineurin-like phosphoesterase [Mycena maculata]